MGLVHEHISCYILGKDLDTHDRDIEYNKELNSTRVKIIDLKKMNPLPHTEINITL